MTAQPLFDGTFSIDAVSATAHAVVQRLHDEAMSRIAELAGSWDQPVEDAPAVVTNESVTYQDPASWSVQDDEDEYSYDEGDDVHVLSMAVLPALLPRPRSATANVTARVAELAAVDLAGAATDEFEVPSADHRHFVAV